MPCSTVSEPIGHDTQGSPTVQSLYIRVCLLDRAALSDHRHRNALGRYKDLEHPDGLIADVLDALPATSFSVRVACTVNAVTFSVPGSSTTTTAGREGKPSAPQPSTDTEIRRAHLIRVRVPVHRGPESHWDPQGPTRRDPSCMQSAPTVTEPKRRGASRSPVDPVSTSPDTYPRPMLNLKAPNPTAIHGPALTQARSSSTPRTRRMPHADVQHQMRTTHVHLDMPKGLNLRMPVRPYSHLSSSSPSHG
ncbi:uncharacterized protein FIBRA_09031 [Fibroporia radiculosa]|uniref:Uncharacterized protein n=1 Tax=Fibroporia radiculosa TaxID=599839 RepID=J4I3P9_9APHY|nr:uncharacterized protein FIBRA_09031 [Fibroporia radiculosa]CCM06737.1 predicted protein [Fibroporia radiculosa]